MELETGELILERLRQAAKVDTDVELSKKLGMSKQAIADAKSKKTVPTSWIPKAAKLFNVSTDWLFFGEGPMRPGEAPQPAANAPEKPVNALKTVSCARCAEMKAELEEERRERRELSAELREVNAENRKLSRENGDLKARCATLTERQKTCCPEPLPLFKKTVEDEGPPNNTQACA